MVGQRHLHKYGWSESTFPVFISHTLELSGNTDTWGGCKQGLPETPLAAEVVVQKLLPHLVICRLLIPPPPELDKEEGDNKHEGEW